MAAAIPTTSEFRAGDWACPACGNHNFASKTACNKCHQTKDGLPAPSGGANHNLRPGDWSCPACGNHNYADKAVCNRCHLPKMQNCLAGGMALGGYGKMKVGKGSGAIRGTPYSKDPVQGLGQMRPGDWICAQCGNHNYASRMACNKCFSPPAHMSNGYLMTAAPLPGGKGGSGKQEGDWTCYACNNLNYASREACNKCQIPKTTFISKSGMRVGDWLCTACSNHNFKDKAWCNKCHGPKGTSTIYQGNMREGDWICTRCANHNYADKMRCNGCQAPKTG